MMITKTISSDASGDIIIVRHHERSHKAFFVLRQFDDFTENIKLISQLIEYLKSYDIKWVEIKLGLNFQIPTNTVWFKNKRNGDVNCHIEDFEQFYLANIKQLVKSGNLYISNPTDWEDNVDNDKSDQHDNDSGEWQVVFDKKHAKKQKINKIKKEVDSLLEDWNNLK